MGKKNICQVTRVLRSQHSLESIQVVDVWSGLLCSDQRETDGWPITTTTMAPPRYLSTSFGLPALSTEHSSAVHALSSSRVRDDDLDTFNTHKV